MADSADLLARRKQELERRLAELTPAKRAAIEQAWAEAAAETQPQPTGQRTIPARPSGSPTPMSFAQELLWLLERTNPGHTYNVPRSVRLTGPLDLDALQRALDAIVDRHESLRTTYGMVGDQASQIVHPQGTLPLALIDLHDIPEANREAEARRHVRELASRPFDLERDLQLRAAVIRLADMDHVLVLVSHHIASDGWSGNIIMRELAALYDGFRINNPVALPAPGVQYADYAAWQRNVLSGQHLEDMLAYWRYHLSGAPASIDLPTDRPRPAIQSFDGGARATTGPVELLARLRSLAQEEGATTFMTLLAAFYALLWRLTGTEEIVVATPVAGRVLPELDGTVGFFTNTLLLRASLAGGPSFRSLLHQVRDACLAGYEHQQVPLEALLLDRRPEGGFTSPQVMFMTEDPGRETFRLPGTESTRFGAARGATKFDLTLHAAERAEGLRLSAEFRTDLFDGDTIERLLRHYVVLLGAAIDAPDAALATLSIMEPAERARVIEEFNRTEIPVDPTATVHGLFAAQVARTPRAPAVTYGTESLTYAELNRRADHFAGRLRRLGVGRETLVGICLPRSLDLIIAVLGILKAGGCYLPLDAEYPPERLALLVADSGVSLIVTSPQVQDALPAGAARLIAVDTDDADDLAHGGSGDSASLAYVIYTSGSTGQPKGVEIEHRSVVNFLAGIGDALPLESSDILLAITPLSFDIAVLELIHPLVSGARVVIAPSEAASDPHLLAELLASTGATHLQATPSTWRLLVESDWTGQPGLVALCGGESLPETLAAALLARGVDLWNLYGPTEATIWATLQQVTATDRPIPIGRPMANVTAYVLDAALQPVPIGVSGELYLGGRCLARGYRGRPELTAERFVRDPFSGREGARMYRTGDRARWRPDGTLECLGRTDFQVKIRGHRIELGEIEHALARAPDVHQAVVVMREDTPGNQRVVAYVVPREHSSPDAAALRTHVRNLLPAVMVPATIVFLDRLPLTPNGKIDRKALPRPGDTPRAVQDEYVPPVTPLEEEIAGIWSALLGVAQIGMHDDFFDLGGNSLLAMRMIAQVERTWGRRLPFQSFFGQPTVANVVSVLESAARVEEEAGAVVLQHDGPGTPLAFVHGDLLGYGWYARRLAPLLGDAPLIVLPTLGPRTAESCTSIEAMASAHIASLRRVQPHGPYRLGGFCAGGMIAYEMARQLAAVGEVVERVVMVDAFCSNLRLRTLEPVVRVLSLAPSAGTRLRRRAALYSRLHYWPRRLRQVRMMTGADQRQWLARVFRRSMGLKSPAPEAPARLVPDDEGLQPIRDLASVAAESRALFQFVARAQRGFMPQRYDGPVDVVWASEALAIRPWLNATGGWDAVASHVRSHTVDGTHVGIVAPDRLPALAQAIRASLDRAATA